MGKSLELPYTLGSSQRKQEKNLLGQSTQRSGAKRFKSVGKQKTQNLREVSGRRTHPVGWSRYPKRTQQVPKNWVAREGTKMELEHHGEHRSIALDGGDTKTANRKEPPEEIRHLGEVRLRDGVALRATPGPVNRPLQLVVGAQGRTARQRSLRRYRRGETSCSGESLDSLQA